MNGAIISMEKYENRKKDSVGSSRIRGKWIWENWDECEEYQIGREYGFLIFQKCYWRKMLEDYKGIKVFDLCDADWLDPRPVFEVLSHCDAVTTSTEPLAEYIRKLVTIPVVCIPDRIDLNAYPKYKQKHEGKAKELIWFGYHQNQTCLKRTLGEIERRDLRLTVVSNEPFTPHETEKGNCEINNIKYEQDKINEEILKRDIVLLPAVDDLRGKYKSNNKTISSWSLGMPVAKEPKDLDLFSDPEERTKEGLKRRKEVEKDWVIDKSVAQWKELICSLQQS